MIEDIVSVLLRADRITIPFEEMLGARHVDVIVAATGGELKSFNFIDDDLLIRSPLNSAQLKVALSGRQQRIDLVGPITVEAVVTWAASRNEVTVAVHRLVLCSGDGQRAELSREGAVYGYSMALVDRPVAGATSN